MATNYPINSRVRAYGKARLDIATRAVTPEDWEKLWRQPAHTFPFSWTASWKYTMEYKVDDFAAEVGFFTDILALPVYALNAEYAMFTSPQGDFFFSIVPAQAEGCSTPPDAIRLQFMLADIIAACQELQRRGIVFEQSPAQVQPDSSLVMGSFRTPHGILIDLWGMVGDEGVPEVVDRSKSRDEDDDDDDDDDDAELLPDDETEEDDTDEGGTENEPFEDDEFDELADDEEDDDDLIFNEGDGEDQADEDDDEVIFDDEDLYMDDDEDYAADDEDKMVLDPTPHGDSASH